MSEIKLPSKGKNRDDELRLFADELEKLRERIGFKISARGWCYQCEQLGLINKAQFDIVENLINGCRKSGVLPVDFTAEEEARKFSGVEYPTGQEPADFYYSYLRATDRAEDYYTPDWWDGEEYYIQMVVEKIDLKTLFEPVCEKYHIPICTSKGWSSILQRAEYTKRFKEAEENGLKCVLLYAGDFDPDGLRISDKLRKNLYDVQNIRWSNGDDGYDPTDLIIDRFGLNKDLIDKLGLTWIDNLATQGGYLAKMENGGIVQGRTKNGKPHPNFYLPYVQDYLKNYGVRKCEANAIVPRPDEARELCEEAIENYLGDDALERFTKRKEKVVKKLRKFKKEIGLDEMMRKILSKVDEER